jgi:hypothetical protein
MYKKKEKRKQKSKNSGADWIRSTDLWIKNPPPNRLSYVARKYLYSDCHYESPNLEQWGIVLYLDIIYIQIST